MIELSRIYGEGIRMWRMMSEVRGIEDGETYIQVSERRFDNETNGRKVERGEIGYLTPSHHLPTPGPRGPTAGCGLPFNNLILWKGFHAAAQTGRCTRRRGVRAVCVTDHGGAGGPRPAALVKRARRIRAAARLKAIRPPSGGRPIGRAASRSVTDSQ
ncbi:hypothetical protein KGM_200596 [Danaus plexippus plexippus]|uniref:Uncharacterized protein n=1 Tax=Danaus plexippus plexippus TaxID=278856 RepID=A0A212FD07_DANPL|nr:hypothetical protein KGM_200596 [Danaus plexippus plexippus]